jgi:hypothetical protein
MSASARASRTASSAAPGGARRVDLVDRGRMAARREVGRSTSRATPVTASTEVTRSAGTRDQFDTEG